MERSIVLALALCASMAVHAQPVKLALGHLEASSEAREVSAIGYFVGGLLGAIGYASKSDPMKIAGGVVFAGGVTMQLVGMRRQRKASDILREL